MRDKMGMSRISKGGGDVVRLGMVEVDVGVG